MLILILLITQISVLVRQVFKVVTDQAGPHQHLNIMFWALEQNLIHIGKVFIKSL